MPFLFTKGASRQYQASPTSPPGPRMVQALGCTLAFQRDPLNFLTTLTRRYGDLAQFPLLTRPVYFLNRPEHLKYILQERHQNYDRDIPLVDLARIIVGDGLSTNKDQVSWQKQRRLVQPAFHKRSVNAFSALMLAEIATMLERWDRLDGRPIDIAREMEEVAVQIASKTIFRQDFSEQAQAFMHSFRQAHQILGEHLRFPFPPLSLPTPRHQQFQVALQQMNEIVYNLIRQHRQREGDTNDLLSMLLNAVDEETGEGMSDQQIRDEVITFLAAGFETTAGTLAWMWYLLSQHPEVVVRLREELRATAGDGPPTLEDIPRLTYARMIIDETLRLYPPVWLLMRNAVGDDQIGGYEVPAKTWLFYSPYILHRHPAFWQEPERFDPERFAPERQADLPRGAYIPFGLGPHFCIGQGFALQEMVLMLARIARNYTLTLVPGHQVEPLLLITLHMRRGLLMRVQRV